MSLTVVLLFGLVALGGAPVLLQPPSQTPGAATREPGIGKPRLVAGTTDVYEVGPGIPPPRVTRKPTPKYTAAARRAGIQGTVTVSCVVDTKGVCTDVKVVRSLDKVYGLDLEAVKAAKQARFSPTKLAGQPVKVTLTLDLDFALK